MIRKIPYKAGLASANNPMMDDVELGIILSLCRGNVLEIGTYRGVTTGSMAAVAEHVVSVDVTSVPKTTIKGHESCVLPVEEIGALIPQDVRHKVTLILVDPDEAGALGKALAGRGLKYDLILIDGDHSYEGVSRDYAECLPYLSDCGIMLFHDCWHLDIGPTKLLEQLGGATLNDTALGVLECHIPRLNDRSPACTIHPPLE